MIPLGKGGKIKWRLKSEENTHAGVWMWMWMRGLCKCKMFLIPARCCDCMWAAPFRWNMKSYSFRQCSSLMCLDGRRRRRQRLWWWLFCSWQRPWGVPPPVSFHGRMRKRATAQWRSSLSSHFVSRLLCHFSQQPQLHSATSHKGCCCCRGIVTHCLVLKKKWR